MRKPGKVVASLVGVSAVAVCAPEIRAFRRLATITRSVREELADGPVVPQPEGAPRSRA